MGDRTLIWVDSENLLSINEFGEGKHLTKEEALKLGYKLPDLGMTIAEDDGKAADETISSIEEKKAEMALASRLKHHSPAARSSALSKAKAEFDSLAKSRDEGEGETAKPKAKAEVKAANAKLKAEEAKPKQASSKKPRPRKWQPSKAYKTSDWHNMECKNFSCQAERTILYRKVKTAFVQTAALRSFYACMLELTYVLEDFYWATGLEKKIARHVAGAAEVAEEYNLGDKNLKALIRQTREASKLLMAEFNKWSKLLELPTLDSQIMGYLRQFAEDGKRISWTHERIKQELEDLSSSSEPHDLLFFLKERVLFEKKHK